MNSSLTQNQHNSIRNIAKQEAISDYDLQVRTASVKGDGYMGIIKTVDLVNASDKLNLILKVAEPSEELRKKFVVRKAYVREMYVYNRIFPKFEQFQVEQGLENIFKGYPKIYDSCEENCNEYLIFENLKEKGYKMWDRKIPMDPQHVALVFSEYAKFHAVSLAMREKQPGEYQELTKDFVNIFIDAYPQEEVNYVIKIAFDNGFKAVKDDRDATEALQRFYDIAATFLRDQLEFSEDSMAVIHGDCWCNNLMFKYEDSFHPQSPTKVCLLDWQVSYIGSPVMDLAYFLFVCSPKEVFGEYKKYLKIYHDTVCENLKKMSCDPEKIFSYSLLERHWQKYAKFGLYMAMVVIKLMLSEQDEIPVFKELAQSEGSIFNGFSYEGVHLNEFNQRISDIVKFMAKNELI